MPYLIKSLDHVHLHIISDDLVSDNLKNKKQYNSFHPSLGFFLHLDHVINWFTLSDAEYREVSVQYCLFIPDIPTKSPYGRRPL